MKKTIEEKAKAYDEAIERAKYYYNEGKTLEYADDIASDIFPELAESEDEKIRKEIINYLEPQGDCCGNKERWIAWLEKQVNDKEQINLPHFTFDDVLALQCCMETVKKVQEDKDLYEKLKDLHGRVYDAYHLEKQGENTENNDWINQNESTDTCDSSVIKDKKFPAGEKRDFGYFSESDNKVEPKFKVGDFIVNDYCRGRVVELTDDAYLLDTGQGIPFSCEHNAHLWTIADAKDGDVLSYRDGQWIFIYKKQVDDNSFHYYSLYSTIHQDLTIDDSAFTLLGDAIIPATKEQRDILFTKMREAGYKWEPEKKELKEIPNVLEECEIEHIEHGKYYYCIKDYYSGGNKRVSKGEVIQALRGMSMMALGVRANEYFIPVKCIVGNRCAWSKKDEDYYDAIIAKLEVTQDDAALTDNQMEFLKSLKQRHTWKPSKEQMTALSEASGIVGMLTPRGTNLQSLYNDLKKLTE